MVQLDGNSSQSITSAVRTIEADAGRIDVLINNAGIAFTGDDRVACLRQILETNLVGAFAVSEAFKPLLLTQAAHAKKDKRIINVSSDLGSITWRSDPSTKTYALPATEYRISKAGMNMMSACQLAELKDLDVKVFAFNPGYTVTELSGPVELRRQHGAWEADVPAIACVEIVEGKRDHEVGKMVEVGGTVPW
jgi:NAD(P)-dependent dehydrogenase (short-subunit alcohol dehydrogenase family)